MGETSRSVGMLIELESRKLQTTWTADAGSNGENHDEDEYDDAISEASSQAAPDEDSRVSMLHMYLNQRGMFGVSKSLQPQVSNHVVAEIFQNVTKDSPCAVHLVEMQQRCHNAAVGSGGQLCWSTMGPPSITSVCVLQPPNPRGRPRQTSRAVGDGNDADTCVPDPLTSDIQKALENELQGENENWETQSEHVFGYDALGIDNGLSEDANDDDGDDDFHVRFAMGLEGSDGDNNAFQSDMGDISVDELTDVQDANEKIAAAASNQFADWNQNKKKLGNVDGLLESEGAQLFCNAHDAEQEAWVTDVLLTNNYKSHAGSNPDDNGDSETDTHNMTREEKLPSQPVGLPRFDQVHDAVEIWRSSLQLSAQALLERRTSLETLELGQNKHLSLVVRVACDDAISVDFVQWVDPKTMEGRVVALDERNGVVCPVHWMTPSLIFSKAEVIHPSIGVSVRRVKKSERPIVPTHIVRLQELYRTCIELTSKIMEDDEISPDPIQSQSLTCVVCGTSTGGIMQCGLCLMHSHKQCLSKVSEVVSSSAALPNHDLKLIDLPGIFLPIDELSTHSTAGASSTSSTSSSKNMKKTNLAATNVRD